MAALGPMVVMAAQGIEVKARRRLSDPNGFETLLDEIQTLLAKLSETQSSPVISDLDLSQNSLTPEQFETLFVTLAAGNVRVQRFRLFGCPTLNDEAMRHLSDHFRENLNNQTAPSELHLSDCAITTEAFVQFMDVIESTDLYPMKHPHTGRPVPLYLRLENNYIDQAIIQEKVDAAIILPYDKNTRQRPETAGIKVHLVVRPGPLNYQQRTGTPPNPEDAPAPKPVYDKHATQSQWQNQNQGTWGNPQAQRPRPQQVMNTQQGMNTSWRVPAVRAPMVQGAVRTIAPLVRAHVSGIVPPRAGFGAAANFTPAPRATGTVYNAAYANPAGKGVQQPMKVVLNNKGGWPSGTAGTAIDRSRTPPQKVTGPMAPTYKPPAKNGNLPKPWEEHWSSEYQIPYYWNSETGEALWEKPAA